MSSEVNFISQALSALLTINNKLSGVTLEGLERQFRHALAQHLFGEVLGWEGYYKVGEIYDIALFDEEEFPIIIVETKGPGVEFTREIKEKLRRRLEELGSVKYGIFANPSRFIICAYEPFELKEVANINVASAIGAARGEYGLSKRERKQILKLEMLEKERLVWIEDPDYFKRTHKEVSVEKGEGVKLLTDNLKKIINDLTGILVSFYDAYWKREHYSGKFLRDTFKKWLKYSMKERDFQKDKGKVIELFCRETAYVILGRILFARICEDKGITEASNLSGERLSRFLKLFPKKRNIYLFAFDEAREEIKRYYRHLHELTEFDWWWIPPEKRGFLSAHDTKNQYELEDVLNKKGIRGTLRRLNRFDFANVNRDILGDVYQGYLPPDERKSLGEFYTPKPVVDYILNALRYKPENEIRGKKLLDPACGSGGFLVEAIQRLISRYKTLGFDLKRPDVAREVIKECSSLIHGLDIHPFACFIAEMNLLFQLLELYDVVRQKDKDYELPRLRIYRTDSLIPPEWVVTELTEFMENYRHKMDIEETKGSDTVKKTRFDFVVGNPPYIRIDNVPKSYRHAYREIYKDLLVGKWDVYIPFVFKGLEWLKKGGKFSYIVSNKFFLLESGLPLRKYLLTNCVIEQIIDLSGVDVFTESIPAPAIVIMTRRE